MSGRAVTGTLVDLARLYRAAFRATLAIQLQYRVSLLIWLLGLVIQPVIYLVVWRTVAGAGQVGGYTAADFAAYYLTLMLVNHATFTWIMHEYDWEIRQGNLSAKLLKPAHPMHFHLADNLTYKLLTLSVVLPALGGLSLAFQPRWTLTPAQVGLGALVVILAAALRWLLEYTLALAAFWTSRVSAINQVYFVVLVLTSGQIAPVGLLPGPLRALAEVLPFRLMLAFPIEVLLGRVEGGALVAGFLGQVLWLAGAVVLFRLLWAAGLRRYTAVGA